MVKRGGQYTVDAPSAKKPKLIQFDSDSEEESSDASRVETKQEEGKDELIKEESAQSEAPPKTKKKKDKKEEKLQSETKQQQEEKSDQDNGSSGIVWDDFTGYSARDIFKYYPFEKLELFYEEQTANYPWMVEKRQRSAPIHLVHHLCNCKKKYSLLLKKGRRITRRIPKDALKEFCTKHTTLDESATDIDAIAIDYCLRNEDLYCEMLVTLRDQAGS